MSVRFFGDDFDDANVADGSGSAWPAAQGRVGHASYSGRSPTAAHRSTRPPAARSQAGQEPTVARGSYVVSRVWQSQAGAEVFPAFQSRPQQQVSQWTKISRRFRETNFWTKFGSCVPASESIGTRPDTISAGISQRSGTCCPRPSQLTSLCRSGRSSCVAAYAIDSPWTSRLRRLNVKPSSSRKVQNWGGRTRRLAAHHDLQREDAVRPSGTRQMSASGPPEQASLTFNL